MVSEVDLGFGESWAEEELEQVIRRDPPVWRFNILAHDGIRAG
jgi:hypothetical protein